MDTPDSDGWTALCWAARGRDESERSSLAGEPYNQVGVIQLLLRSGASLSVEAKIGEEVWSPLQIACYNRATLGVIRALKPSSEQSLLKGDIKFGGSGPGMCDACYWVSSRNRSPGVHSPTLVRLTSMQNTCDNIFACSECQIYELCPKCSLDETSYTLAMNSPNAMNLRRLSRRQRPFFKN